jgi:hypothetical protein
MAPGSVHWAQLRLAPTRVARTLFGGAVDLDAWRG